MVTANDLTADVISFLKTSLASVTDPLSGSRAVNSSFIMSSYPQRKVLYPIITIRVINLKAKRAGMQTTAMDMVIDVEIRV